MRHRSLFTAAIMLAVASRAEAQSCLGRASFDAGAVRTSVGYQSVSWYSGEVAVGKLAMKE